MEIKNNILKHYLKNCYFITGTAYAGKSTMCALLAEKYGMIHCGENYCLDDALPVVTKQDQPDLSYFKDGIDWQAYVSRTPEEFERWYMGTSREITDFEIGELIRLSGEKKVIVDTNIPCHILWEISDYSRVAVMVSPQSMSVERFFQRGDEEKQFLLSVIRGCPEPEKTLRNFQQCIARVNSPEHYSAFVNSGFFTVVRENTGEDTKMQTLQLLARHFGLEDT